MLYTLVKNQDLLKKWSGILSNLGLKTPLCKIPLLDDISFWVYKNEWNS